MPDMVKRISQIFADQVFHVPDYQRGYAWEQRQWDDLLEDLELLPEGRNHFTGTLVLRLRNDGSGEILDEHIHAYEAYDIIDGQQRLTTVVILLKAIYDEMHMFLHLEGLAGRLRETYLHHIDRNGQPFTKLTLNADSQDFFANNILGLSPGIGGPTIRSHERLLGAQQYFAIYFQHKREEKGEDYPEWLQNLYRKVTLQLNLIVYPVEDELDAGTIFETMNDRGKPLTELEKVKNYLLYVAGKLDLPDPHDLNQHINLTWKLIYERLMSAGLAGRGSEDQLLRAHWLMVYDYDASRWENARSIKLRFNLHRYQNRHAELLKDIKNYLHSLQAATAAYCDIFNPWHPTAFNDISNPAIRSQLVLWGRKLTRLGVSASFLPLLIAVRLKAGDDGSTYLKALQLLELYSFRVFSWRRARSNTGQTSLFQMGNRYYQSSDTDWMLGEVARLILLYSSNESFNERFQRETENWYQWQDINYFLYEYEHHLAGGRPVQLTWETINARPKSSSIEHILPQTPQAAYWQDRFSVEQCQRWTHDLANLTLTYDNSGLSNKPFPDKKGAPGQKGTYADSPLFIERELAQAPDWTVEALQARRDKLVAWAKERWKVVWTPPSKPPSPHPTGSGTESRSTWQSLPKEERRQRVRQRFIERAEKMGNGVQFRSLLEVLERFPLYSYLNPMYQGINFTLPQNRTAWVIWLGPDLYTSYHLERICNLSGLSDQEVIQLLGQKRLTLKHDQIPAYIAGLERILEAIQKH